MQPTDKLFNRIRITRADIDKINGVDGFNLAGYDFKVIV